VFDALSRAGITHVCVGFDGESDQGQVRATASADGKSVGFPPLILTLHISQFGSTELTSREFRLQDAVEQLCYDYLEQKHGGWERNQGNFAEFVFDVAARTVRSISTKNSPWPECVADAGDIVRIWPSSIQPSPPEHRYLLPPAVHLMDAREVYEHLA
jgi:hypothetical protein